ncbi:methyltransferase [Pectinatus sottacetonis]|uniref:methyltransferase n=1 Tax=Pectinatus sottacetonis TaxID=1002795 RepID=UPI0018C7196E|nr:methyltransferase [Pectinatus sottacetonis]
MKMPDYSPRIFFNILQQQKETQILLAAIRLDVFSFLDEAKTVDKVADLTGFDKENLGHLLRGLTSMGILDKTGHFYINKNEAAVYLSRNSHLYLGEYFLFWDKKTHLNNIDDLVRFGATAAKNSVFSFYDFHELARLADTEIKTGRVQSLLTSSRTFFSKKQKIRLLDLGGGSGRMAIEFIKEYPQSEGVVFEKPEVADIPGSFIKKENLTGKLSILSGDFLTDNLGTGYDLVIASGVLDFAGVQLQNLLEKIYQACNDEAYLYLVSHNVNKELTAPKEAVLNWLSSNFAGFNILTPKPELRAYLEKVGFKAVACKEQKGVIAKLQGEWYQKEGKKTAI